MVRSLSEVSRPARASSTTKRRNARLRALARKEALSRTEINSISIAVRESPSPEAIAGCTPARSKGANAVLERVAAMAQVDSTVRRPWLLLNSR